MRVVEYQADNTLGICRALRSLGAAACAISMALTVLLIANYVSLKRTDPIHSATLARLLEELKSQPQNEKLRTEIRELDLLARHAYFRSQHFTQLGSYLLLGSVLTTVIAFKALGTYRQKLPYPDPRAPKEDLAENARWARNAVSTAGLLLAGFALMLALPWNSPLDELEKAPSAPAKSVAKSKSAAPAAPAASAVPTAPAVSADDMLKNWPSFRGAASGKAASAGLPIAWDGSTGQGIAWKAAIPRTGFSSPIVWNDRIFVTGGDEEAREIYCFNLQKGALLWRHAVRDVPGAAAALPKVTDDTGFAAPTMATDGKHLFAIFATAEIVALDFDGKRLWAKSLGQPENPFGHASSLVVFENTVFVQMDHQKKGSLQALNTDNGDVRWTQERSFGSSWSSPAIIEQEGQPQLILSASPPVISYDPRTGKQLWRVDCLTRGDVAAVPVAANGMLYASGDSSSLVAIDLKTQKVAWQRNDMIPGVSTPVIIGEWLIYGVVEGGIVCRNARTGQEVWHEETDAGIYASPLVSGDRVYLMDRDGVTHIFKAADKFEQVAICKLGEEASSTPAVAGSSLIVRSPKNLYRIGP